MSYRQNILNGLRDLLTEITEFTTITIVNNLDDKYPYDIRTENLPAIKIISNQEAIHYSPGHQARNVTFIDLYMYAIQWDKENTEYEENLVKLIRDKLGSDISLKGAAGNTDIKSVIKLEVDYPLITYKFNLAVSYVCSTKNV